MMTAMNTRQKTLLLFLALAAVTLAAYARVYQFEFISFDDHLYVTENKEVKQGLSIENIKWAFGISSGHDQTYWHPLTWMSHMLDVELFGLKPAGHHLVNVFFHTLNALLLFLALHTMTGARWRSALVAALFALHPINVDSVAWIAERKNLLSTFFWMLTMLAYIRYAGRPGITRYLLVFLALTLGLLAKPMLVTLPCVLLLLDFWPLGRLDLGQNLPRHANKTAACFQHARPALLILEKLPLLGLSFLSIGMSVFTLHARRQMADAGSLHPLSLRVENALVSYWQYLWKLLWPQNFAFFYPFPESIPHWQAVLAALGLLMVTAFLIIQSRRFPFLCVGWLWFLGTLFPVIGLIQGGLWPALADRWAYVPAMGVFIMTAWGLPEIFKITPHQQKHPWFPAAAILLVLGALTFRQAGMWRDNESLYTHALKVTSGNYIAHNNLGNAIKQEGRMAEAIDHYKQAIGIKPDYADSYYNLANTYKDLGQTDKAMLYYRRTIEIQPNHAKAHNNLGTLLLNRGRAKEAIGHYSKAIQVQPEYESALFNLGIAYFQTGNKSGAAASFREALRLNPGAKHIQAALDQTMKMP